jgi:hypothetical protein
LEGDPVVLSNCERRRESQDIHAGFQTENFAGKTADRRVSPSLSGLTSREELHDIKRRKECFCVIYKIRLM